jgi:hypothetical protein
MISAAAVSTISLTYASGGAWSVFNATSLCTAGNLQANWTDIASQLGGLYKPLLNSAVDELGILSGVSGAQFIGISGTTGIASGSTVYSAIINLNSSLSSGAGPTFNHVHLTNGQIGFPAVQVPSVDANTLDDYEEGLWTPSLLFGGASVGMTFTTQLGVYTKTGNRVFFTAYIVLSAKGSSAGSVLVGGLPFTSKTGDISPIAMYLNGVSFANAFQGYVGQNSTYIGLYEVTEAGSKTDLNDTDFINTSTIIMSGQYQVA